MPCNSDYMNPTEREANGLRVCELLTYALTALGKGVPKWIIEGADPCARDRGNGHVYGHPERLDEAVALLCATIRGMSARERDRIVYNGRIKYARQLADFWDAHQDADAKRMQAEAEERIRDEAEFERLRRKLGRT